MSGPTELDSQITVLLQRWGKGDREALEELLPMVYQDLRRLARRQMKSLPPGSTFQATGLVHEVYLRLLNSNGVEWQGRGHFFAIASKLARQVAVDSARARQRLKRGGGWTRVMVDCAEAASPVPGVDLIAVDQALTRLHQLDERKAHVVEMRFFGGLENQEIAEVLQVSVDTVKRDWIFAKLWMARQMGVEAGA